MKIGIIGAGHLGKIHVKCASEIDELELVGVYDIDPVAATSTAEKYSIHKFENIIDLIDKVEAIDIVTPTTTHFEIAKHAIERGKHVFIEKPICTNPEEAGILEKLAEINGVKVQVGHVERFNPAYKAIKDYDLKPHFIEGHRLSIFNPRGTDVSVVLDLMIHDLDLVLKLIPYDVIDLQVSGVSVISDTTDICNARIHFENGSVANLTASRISMKTMRKLRLFQSNAYISMDLFEKETQVFRMKEPGMSKITEHALEIDLEGTGKTVIAEAPKIIGTNAIKEELFSFYNAISNDLEPEVTISDGKKVLQLALNILDNIK